MSGKTVAILQSSYIPWKGYFDIINDVDTFIFYDDVQFTSRDWRSRNQIRTPTGNIWLSIPVGDHLQRLIHEVTLGDHRWQAKHWRSIQMAYGRAPYFKAYSSFFEPVYMEQEWTSLSLLNQTMTRMIAREILGITTEFRDSREYGAEGQKLDRLIDLVKKTGATRYLSGPSAASYIDPGRFAEIDVELLYKDYAGYPEYPQRGGDFTHTVSILDLVFQLGPAAPDYIWGWRASKTA